MTPQWRRTDFLVSANDGASGCHSRLLSKGSPAVLILDLLVDFFPVDNRIGAGLDPKADLLSLDLHDDDFDVIADGDSLANFPSQNKHNLTLPGQIPDLMVQL